MRWIASRERSLRCALVVSSLGAHAQGLKPGDLFRPIVDVTDENGVSFASKQLARTSISIGQAGAGGSPFQRQRAAAADLAWTPGIAGWRGISDTLSGWISNCAGGGGLVVVTYNGTSDRFSENLSTGAITTVDSSGSSLSRLTGGTHRWLYDPHRRRCHIRSEDH